MNDVKITLYIALDIADDDVSLQEVAEQCGYDVSHPWVLDMSAPQVAEYHEQEVLMFHLVCRQQVTDADLFIEQVKVVLSHPSVAAVTVLGLDIS